MNSFWRPRNTWEKSRPLIQSGWSSLPQNFSASATPRNSASKRNSRRSSLCTTNTRIQTLGEYRELSRNFTQKSPSEDIIVLLFFFLNVSHVFVHVGTCIHFKGIFTLIQVMVNESCSSSRDLCLQPWVQLCMYYNASWSKLIHILILLVQLYMMGIWFEISLYPCNSYSPTVWKFWKMKMFLRVLENIWKKKVLAMGVNPTYPMCFSKNLYFFFYHVCQFLMVIC